MAYVPDNKQYLPMKWDGIVTQNDIAIQNQPWSLGQHLGPTREQAAQQELEAWFRSQGLDPNQYYEAAGVAPPQPGFNPAGGQINYGRPVKSQEIYSGGRTKDEYLAQQKANAQWGRENAITFNRKDAAAAGHARQAAARAAGAPGIPDNALALNAAMMANAQINGPNMLQTTYKPPAATSAPVGNQSFLPPYLQPGGGVGGGVPGVPQTNSITGAPPVNPIGTPPMSGAPLVTGGINTGAGFGKTAKLLDLPYYLRGGIKT